VKENALLDEMFRKEVTLGNKPLYKPRRFVRKEMCNG
jgi:hypothetical protein